LDSSDVEEGPGRDKRKRGGPSAAGKHHYGSLPGSHILISIAREVSDIPPNEPPEERYVISCLSLSSIDLNFTIVS
jgi:hypothetical protein